MAKIKLLVWTLYWKYMYLLSYFMNNVLSSAIQHFKGRGCYLGFYSFFFLSRKCINNYCSIHFLNAPSTCAQIKKKECFSDKYMCCIHLGWGNEIHSNLGYCLFKICLSQLVSLFDNLTLVPDSPTHLCCRKAEKSLAQKKLLILYQGVEISVNAQRENIVFLVHSIAPMW